MSIKDNHSRIVTFETRDELGDKIDKLTVMIGKLAARDSGSGRQFKPQICEGKKRGQNRGSYARHNYGQQDYQNRYRSVSQDKRWYRQDRSRPRYKHNHRGRFLEVMQECITFLKERIVEESTEIEMNI